MRIASKDVADKCGVGMAGCSDGWVGGHVKFRFRRPR